MGEWEREKREKNREREREREGERERGRERLIGQLERIDEAHRCIQAGYINLHSPLLSE